MVDGYTHYIWIILINTKDVALSAFKKSRAGVELEVDQKMKALRTDRGVEFTSKEFEGYRESLGVKRFRIVPYSPQQNGVVERRNQTAAAMARS